MVSVKQIKVCGTLLGRSEVKKTRDERGHGCDKTYLGSLQTYTQRYVGSY